MSVVDLTPASLIEALGAAVLHYLWQGALIGAVAAVLLAALPGRDARTRHAVALGAMAAGVLCFFGTLAVEIAAIGRSGALAGSALDDAALLAMLNGPARQQAGVLDAVAWVWVAGFAFLVVRLMVQSLAVRRLTRRGLSEPDLSARSMFCGLVDELGVRGGVRFFSSTIAQVPMVVGWFSPVVLVPASAFVSLTPEQLRAVLAHELAHIRRHDHLLNLAQAFAESLLFFHPVTWWLSSRVRVEREYCCDDAAVRSVPSPRVFAEALAALESHRSGIHAAVVAANGGSLMERISRIVGVKAPGRRAPMWRVGMAIAAGAAVAAAGLAHAARQVDEVPRDTAVEALRLLADYTEDTEQLKELYMFLVFRGSEEESKMLAELDAVERHLDARVAEGAMSEAQAAERRAAVDASIERATELSFMTSVLGMSKAEARRELQVRGIRAQLEAGEITEEQAEKRQAEILAREVLVGRLRLIESGLHERLHERVVAGELSEQDAKVLLEHELFRLRLGEIKEQAAGEVVTGHFVASYAEIQEQGQSGRVRTGVQLPLDRSIQLRYGQLIEAEREVKGQNVGAAEVVVEGQNLNASQVVYEGVLIEEPLEEGEVEVRVRGRYKEGGEQQ
ncbi:MAG: M56 family metallopeptidase [Planctomycetota bacterium]